MSEHLKMAVEETVKHLLPGCVRSVETLPIDKFKEKHLSWQGNLSKSSGTLKEGKRLFLWMRQPDDSIREIEISRKIDLTVGEMRLFKTFGSTVEAFFPVSQRRASRTAASMASMGALGDILVARYLSPQSGSTFYSPLMVLNELRRLALQRYEGNPCSSGAVYAADVGQYIQSIDPSIYDFDRLGGDARFEIGFFDDPATYRYVDGRNAFYLLDNVLRVHGVLRLRSPGTFSLPDRSNFAHLRPLGMGAVGGGGARSFVAFVGRNNDVHVATRGTLTFRWEKLRWTMFDRKIFSTLLEKTGLSVTNADSLASVLLAASELRMGALVLIPDDVSRLPSNAGAISSSSVAEELQKSIRGKHVTPLVASGAAIGVLTSDGLTIISQQGEFIDAGKIIDLARATARTDAGGGRTQAALAASDYGLAIKVSEDGPISVFRAGEAIARFAS